jgi:repressor of nif and glnA expression
LELRTSKESGIKLGKRVVRYYFKLMDECQMTQLVRRRDGRVLTELCTEELENVLKKEKVGLAISRIKQLAFHTVFDLGKHTVTFQ